MDKQLDDQARLAEDDQGQPEPVEPKPEPPEPKPEETKKAPERVAPRDPVFPAQ